MGGNSFWGIKNSGRPVFLKLRTNFWSKILFFFRYLNIFNVKLNVLFLSKIEWFGLRILGKEGILIALPLMAPARQTHRYGFYFGLKIGRNRWYLYCTLPSIAHDRRTYGHLFIFYNYIYNCRISLYILFDLNICKEYQPYFKLYKPILDKKYVLKVQISQ